MIKVHDIAYVTYRGPDLDRMERFLVDFGMQRSARTSGALYMRGAGSAHHIYVFRAADEPAFDGIAMWAAGEENLEKAAGIEGASAVEEIDEPGGGRRVRLVGPEGCRIDIVHGIEEVEELPLRDPLVFNYAREKRRLNSTQRPEREPAQILRLGHTGFSVTDPKKAAAWFQDNLGMLPSDSLYGGPPDNLVGCFLRCDRGDEYVDHHTVFVIEAPRCDVHHSSFEVQDFDAQHLGHEWLRSKGYRHHWGIGRHILGSQIFDYWLDPNGFRLEHFADGDLCNRSFQGGTHEASPEILAQWGPPVPEAFLD